MTGLSLIEQALVGYGARFPDHPRKWWLHERLRRGLGVAVDGDLEVVRRGLRWSLNPADYAHESLFWLGTKDTWDLHHLRRLVRPGGVAIDAGSNFGYYALNLAGCLGREGRVLALEPNPANFERLCRHVAWNRIGANVQTHRLGLSDRLETVRMTEPAGNSGHTAVAAVGEIRDVALTTLDAFTEAEGLDRLDVLVVDVEGFEERALRGASETLQRFTPLVVVELFAPVMSIQGSSPEAAARVLTDLGYRLFAARRGRLVPLETLPSGDVRVNAFAIHRDRPGPS